MVAGRGRVGNETTTTRRRPRLSEYGNVPWPMDVTQEETGGVCVYANRIVHVGIIGDPDRENPVRYRHNGVKKC